MSESIRVMLVDDQTLFRVSLGMLLAAQPGLDVVGEAANGAEALERVAALRPDVVLMDLHMPIWTAWLPPAGCARPFQRSRSSP